MARTLNLRPRVPDTYSTVTLVGVAVGAVIGFLGTWLNERHADRRSERERLSRINREIAESTTVYVQEVHRLVSAVRRAVGDPFDEATLLPDEWPPAVQAAYERWDRARSSLDVLITSTRFDLPDAVEPATEGLLGGLRDGGEFISSYLEDADDEWRPLNAEMSLHRLPRRLAIWQAALRENLTWRGRRGLQRGPLPSDS